MSKSVRPEIDDDEYEDDFDDERDRSAPPKRLYRGRAGIIALTALLTELVVVGAVGNQFVAEPVSDRLTDRAATAPDYEIGGLQALLTYAWRFAPGSGQSTKEWASAFAAIGTLFVLTLFLGWVVSRGSVTFSRIWVSIAAIVAAVTPVAVMVRNLVVIPASPGPRQSQIGQAVYGPSQDGEVVSFFGPAILFGLALGVIVGLIAAIVAVLSRRKIVLPAPAPAPAPAPLNAYGEPTPGYSPPPWQPEPDYREALAAYARPVPINQDEQRTTALPVAAATEALPRTDDTEQLPAVPHEVQPAQPVRGQEAPGVPTPAEEAALAEPVTAELAGEINTADIPAVQEEPVPPVRVGDEMDHTQELDLDFSELPPPPNQPDQQQNRS